MHRCRVLVIAGVVQLAGASVAAAAGENRWAADQTRKVLLAPVGGESFDEAAIRSDVAADRGIAPASRVESSGCAKEFGESGREGRRGVWNVTKMGQFLVLPCPEAHGSLFQEGPVPFGT